MQRRSQFTRLRLIVGVLLPVLYFVLGVGEAHARSCDGPSECCPPTQASSLPASVRVQLGIVLVGLHNVDEKSGTWDADFYLNESWPATPGFAPATEIVNEVARQSEQFDDVDLRSGRCFRSRRVHSTLRSSYNLRTFPFDHQRLTLEFSDAEFAQELLRYTDRPSVSDLDDEAKDQLSNWKIAGPLDYAHKSRIFREDGAAPRYDYATFSLPVRRHIAFHLTKFFLPLLVIVAVAFSVSWIHPEDLNTKASIGVTCLLAAIAFQLAEAGMLPEVAYLTLADRVYAICYTMLALSLMLAVYANSLVRREQLAKALKLDRICRVAFPAMLVVLVVLSIFRSSAAGLQ